MSEKKSTKVKTTQNKAEKNVKNISKNPACRKKIQRVLSFERKNPACENPACAKTLKNTTVCLVRRFL